MAVVSEAHTFFSPESLQDPYPLFERMRAAGPVHRIGDSEFYAVCGWDAIVEASSRTEDFSNNLTATMTYTDEGTIRAFQMEPVGGPTHVLATADDPAHVVHRKLVTRYLAARRVRAWRSPSRRPRTDYGPRACGTGVSSGWMRWPTGCP